MAQEPLACQNRPLSIGEGMENGDGEWREIENKVENKIEKREKSGERKRVKR